MKKFLIMLTVVVCLSSAFFVYAIDSPQFPELDWTSVEMNDTGEKLMCLPLEQSHMVMDLLKYIQKQFKFVSSPKCAVGYVYTCNVPRYAWRDNKCTVYKCNLRPY